MSQMMSNVVPLSATSSAKLDKKARWASMDCDVENLLSVFMTANTSPLWSWDMMAARAPRDQTDTATRDRCSFSCSHSAQLAGASCGQPSKNPPLPPTDANANDMSSPTKADAKPATSLSRARISCQEEHPARVYRTTRRSEAVQVARSDAASGDAGRALVKGRRGLLEARRSVDGQLCLGMREGF